jgi:hypothetical protein
LRHWVNSDHLKFYKKGLTDQNAKRDKSQQDLRQ